MATGLSKDMLRLLGSQYKNGTLGKVDRPIDAGLDNSTMRVGEEPYFNGPQYKNALNAQSGGSGKLVPGTNTTYEELAAIQGISVEQLLKDEASNPELTKNQASYFDLRRAENPDADFIGDANTARQNQGDFIRQREANRGSSSSPLSNAIKDFPGPIGTVSDVFEVGSVGAVDPLEKDGWAQGGNFIDAIADAGSTATGGVLDDPVNSLIDAGGDIVSGMTDGDASSEAFNKYWPYKNEQLQGAQDVFNSGDTLNPDFSQDTKTYQDLTRNRAINGNSTLDNAEIRLNTLFGSENPAGDFYNSAAHGGIGQNDPSKNFFGNYDYNNPTNGFFNDMSNGKFSGTNPAYQGYSDIKGRVGENPINDFYGNTNLLSGNRAFDQLGRTANGEYLNNNPYLDQTFDRASGKVTDAYSRAVDGKNSNFSLAGRYGSGAHQASLKRQNEGLGDALGGLANDIYGGNYQQERDRMVNALNPLGSFSDSSTNRLMRGADTLGNQFNFDTGIMGDVTRGMGNLYNQDLDRRTNAAGTISNQYDTGQGFNFDANRASSDIYNTGINRQFDGAAGQSNVHNSNFGNILNTMNPALNFANQDYVDLGQLGAVGSMNDDLNYRRAQEPWQNVNNYGAAIGGIPSQQPQPGLLDRASQIATIALPFVGGK